MPQQHRPWRRVLKVAWPLALLIVVLYVLAGEINKIDPAAVLVAMRSLSWQQGVIALGLTAISYVVLTTYDLGGVIYINGRLSAPRVMLTSFVTYSFNYTFGTLLGAVGMRVRYYSLLKLSGEDIAKVTAFAGVTSWIGYALLAGTLFVAVPLSIPIQFDAPFATMRPLGLLLLALAAGYVGLCWRHVPALHVRSWRFKLPGLRLALAQFIPSVFNWMIVATIVYVLMPADAGVPYLRVVSVYLLGAVAGIIVRVPAGLGVLEGAFLWMLADAIPPAAIVGSLLAFRLVYFLVPLAVGVLAAGAAEWLFRVRPDTERSVSIQQN